MLTAIIIAIVVPIVIMSFIPERKWPKSKKRTPLFKNWQPDDTGGLPWFSHKKKTRREKKYLWDD